MSLTQAQVSRASGRTPPLWRQLQAAARLVAGVRAGQSLSTQLPQVDGALRPGAQALSFHALRWLGLATHLRSQLVRHAPPAQADALLCTVLALMQPHGHAPYADFTLVDQAVEAAKRDNRTRSQAGLINACLRRYLREADALLAQAQGSSEAFWNHPKWWVQALQQDHPEHWRAVLQTAQRRPPLVLRVNRQRSSVADVMRTLAAAGMDATALGGDAVHLHQPCPVGDIPGFSQGHVSVQSASAQWAAPLLLNGLPPAALRVLDACAAPGGKTAHLLEICPHAQVTALELDEGRAARIQGNLGRLGLHATLKVADAGDTAAWWDGQTLFDAILLDAPCSASGIVARHPDVRWLRRASDIPALAAQQDRLLRALWPLLKPGGRLLYATCSVFRQEGEQRIAAFLQSHAAHRLPAPGHMLPGEDYGACVAKAGALGLHSDNPPGDDGFYYALLEKPLA